MSDIQLYNGDCLDIMKSIPDSSVDMVLCDLPYGTTKCSWDIVIPFDELWKEYNRVMKSHCNVILFSSGMFTIDLILSNREMFKYRMIWKKNVPTGMTSAKVRLMKYFEEICVFNNGHSTYNPIMKDRVGVGRGCYRYKHYCGNSNHIDLDKIPKVYSPDFVNPSDILEFNVVPNRSGKLHPTQNPVELCEYLIRTYSNDGDVVLDNCMGSGTTGVACKNLNRNFIGIEKDSKYFEIAKKRIEEL